MPPVRGPVTTITEATNKKINAANPEAIAAQAVSLIQELVSANRIRIHDSSERVYEITGAIAAESVLTISIALDDKP